MNSKAKPFVKWAGGKSQILNKLSNMLPQEIRDGKIKTYIEPFVGGGAMLFEVLQNYSINRSIIIDVNKELINCYRCIKADVQSFICVLQNLEDCYLSLNEDSRSTFYYEVRSRYNSVQLNGNLDFEKAADFIFLNHTCFNGLYRVNKNGEFNVPFGKYKNPKICDAENLINVSNLLQNTEILYGDYSLCDDYVTSNTLIYFDPPYRPLTAGQSFVGYAKNGFGDEDQQRLCAFYRKADAKGAKLMLSNSDPKNTNPEDDFFDKLYEGFSIKRIYAKRMINCQADKRGDITEIVVTNFKENCMEREFNAWLNTFKKSICDYNFYVNFDKVYNNVDEIKVPLNILNSLIGSKNIEKDFTSILKQYPEVLKCIPILLAVRSKEIYAIDADGEFAYNFSSMNYSVNEYVTFMHKTGLFRLISEKIINNLVDYVTGIEVGLDSNGRKNRGGHLMENLLEDYLRKFGFESGKDYFKEMYLSAIERKWGLDLSAISNQGKAEKRFDFVVYYNKKVYAMETNFYSGGGSKLNETARSYKTIALEAKNIQGFKFVWFTDGLGWKLAKRNLEETFDVLNDIYNIADLENDILKELFRD